ncbi:MAG: VOC family protein [Nitrososphaerota archaeon]|nr:VOC family protein [Nitrososphaerota archaeon]MDG6939081.1 VOC family protein [Nitrososphaerota archaeon]
MIIKNYNSTVMVSDAAKSAQWFKERLGFRASVHDHWVTVWPAGSTSKVHLCQGELEPGNTGIGFYTKNVRAEVDKLKGKGVTFTKDVTKTEWGTFAMFADPDRNEYWILQGKP